MMFHNTRWLIFYAILAPIIAITAWWYGRTMILPTETLELQIQADQADYGWFVWPSASGVNQPPQVINYFDTPQIQQSTYPITVTIVPMASQNPASQGNEVWLLDIWTPTINARSWEAFETLPAESGWQRTLEQGVSQRFAMRYIGSKSEPFTYVTETTGGDVTLMLVQHPWSGGVNISINGGEPTFIDLYNAAGTIKDVRIPAPRDLGTLKRIKLNLPLHGTETLRWHVSSIPSNLRVQSIKLSGLRTWEWQAGDTQPRAGIGIAIKSNDSNGLLLSNNNSTSGWLEWSELPSLPPYPSSQPEQLFILFTTLLLWIVLLLGWFANQLPRLQPQKRWVSAFAFLSPILALGGTIGALLNRTTDATIVSVRNEIALFRTEAVVSDLETPVGISFANDGRMFVIEKGGFSGPVMGKVKLIQPGQTTAETILEVPVCSDAERGLIGMTLDPQFASNGYLYLYYTRQLDNCAAPSNAADPVANRVARFTVANNTIDPASEVVLVDGILGKVSSHNAGGLRFLNDGTLLIATGENVPGKTAQDLTLLGGKILRINPDPQNLIPADNPFANESNPNTRLIWAYGLRNPFRFGVSDTNMVLIGDVGSAPPLSREEINLGKPGANYGWPDSEGITNDSKFVSPIYSYEHDNACNSIIGGTFVRDGYGPTYANN
ncbi:MAG: hypothetical protein Fur005_22640 [Roseiflexaceae bacterium]